MFYFYSNEHEPIHVHVIHNACESIFDMIISDGTLVEIRQRARKGVDPLSAKDVKTAEQFIQTYANNIIRKWINFFVLKQQVRSTIIKKKI